MKKLYRSREGRVIAGVAGGLAEYWNVDPNLVRLAFILLAFWNGLGILIYLVGWLLIPEAPGQEGENRPERDLGEMLRQTGEEVAANIKQATNQQRLLLGVLLVVFGLIFLVDNFLPGDLISKLWPVILVIFGLVLLAKAAEHKERS